MANEKTVFHDRVLYMQYMQTERFLAETRKNFVSTDEFFKRGEEVAVTRCIDELVQLHLEFIKNCQEYGII